MKKNLRSRVTTWLAQSKGVQMWHFLREKKIKKEEKKELMGMWTSEETAS